jgi:hypothetical protein
MEQFVNAVSSRQIPSCEETIRKNHINHESSVRSIGIFYYLNAALLIITSIIGGIIVLPSEDPLFVKILACIIFIGIGVFQFYIGRGLRTLRKWSRIPTIILSGIGLLAFPLGTVVNAYFLYLVVCEKGRTVFSDEYKSVIKATPYIRYKISIVVWIFLGLFGLVVVLLGITAIMSLISRLLIR